MKLTGTLTEKGIAISYGANGFTKREIVVTTVEQYPQPIMLELHGDKVDIIDAYEVGANIEVTFNPRGRKWEDPNTGDIKYFNSLVAWKVQPFKG